MADTDVVGHVQKLDSGNAARRTVAVHWFIYVVNKDTLMFSCRWVLMSVLGMDGC